MKVVVVGEVRGGGGGGGCPMKIILFAKLSHMCLGFHHHYFGNGLA